MFEFLRLVRLAPWANVMLYAAILLGAFAVIFGQVSQDIGNFKVYKAREIHDPVGKTAQIETLITAVASRELNWVFNSYDEIERFGVKTDFKSHLITPGISRRLMSYKAIIAVGAASEELNPTASSIKAAISLEKQRAYLRAKQLRLWIKEAFPSPPPIYLLNLGVKKVSAVKEEDTADQRMIVLIGIIKMDEGFDIEPALKSNLANKHDFPFRLSDYSTFILGDKW